MNYLPNSATWQPGVYQIEKEDDVLGGEDGPDNKPLKDLARRTAFLKMVIGTIINI